MKVGKYFDSSEFDDPTAPGTGEMINRSLVSLLDGIREDCGFPLIVTSGVRTAAHNADVGGKSGSEHLTGQAVDISAPSSRQKYLIVRHALFRGVSRIGIGSTFVHLGIDSTKAQNVIWTY